MTLAKNRRKYFCNEFRRAFEHTFWFLATTSRSRGVLSSYKSFEFLSSFELQGGRFSTPLPPIRWWKIQRPIRARVKHKPCSAWFAELVFMVGHLSERQTRPAAQHITKARYHKGIQCCCVHLAAACKFHYSSIEPQASYQLPPREPRPGSDRPVTNSNYRIETHLLQLDHLSWNPVRFDSRLMNRTQLC